MTSEAKPTKANETVENEAPFAVIESGGKQYMVTQGDTIDVELLHDCKEGEEVVFDKVLMSTDGSATTIGTPYIEGAKVTGECIAQTKGKKLSIIRFESKSNRSRKVGHRQPYTRVTITTLA